MSTRVIQLMSEGHSVGQVADKTGLSTVEVREALAAAELARGAQPRSIPRPAPVVRPAAPAPAPPAQPQTSQHDQLLERARQVPKLAKLVAKHDELMEQIEQRLQVDEQAAREERKRQMALERARESAEKARKDYEAAQARLRELGGAKPKRPLSAAQLAALRANAEKARAAATAKREANR